MPSFHTMGLRLRFDRTCQKRREQQLVRNKCKVGGVFCTAILVLHFCYKCCVWLAPSVNWFQHPVAKKELKKLKTILAALEDQVWCFLCHRHLLLLFSDQSIGSLFCQFHGVSLFTTFHLQEIFISHEVDFQGWCSWKHLSDWLLPICITDNSAGLYVFFSVSVFSCLPQCLYLTVCFSVCV